MLGTVVWTLGLRVTQRSTEAIAPGCLSFSALGFAPPRPRPAPPAMIFMATTPLPALAATSSAAVTSGCMVKLYALRITSIFSCLARNGTRVAWLLCVLTPAKRILPAFLAVCWASISSSVISSGRLLACRYQMST